MNNIQGTQPPPVTFSAWRKQIINKLTTLVIVSFKEATRARNEPEGTEMKARSEEVTTPSQPGPQWEAKAQELVRLGTHIVTFPIIVTGVMETAEFIGRVRRKCSHLICM